jgi:hypothetical protein
VKLKLKLKLMQTIAVEGGGEILRIWKGENLRSSKVGDSTRCLACPEIYTGWTDGGIYGNLRALAGDNGAAGIRDKDSSHGGGR